MNKFDKYIKQQTKEEHFNLPSSTKECVEYALSKLPELETSAHHFHIFPRASMPAAAAICFSIIALFILPNVSTVYAQTLEQIPILGRIVRVITIRNYFYSADRHELDVNVPKVEFDIDDSVAELINKDIDELASTLVDRFYNETVHNNSYGSILVNYDIITDTDRWFTLKLSVHETAGSSNSYFKYYHIDKATGLSVTLGDLFTTDDFCYILINELKSQMKQQMAADPDIVYWSDNSIVGADFIMIDEAHNFYFNSNNELVIPFDKYEIAPGYMRCPEFVIPKEIIGDILKKDFFDMIN